MIYFLMSFQSTYENFTPSGKLSPAFNGCGAASSGEVSVDMMSSLDFPYRSDCELPSDALNLKVRMLILIYVCCLGAAEGFVFVMPSDAKRGEPVLMSDALKAE